MSKRKKRSRNQRRNEITKGIFTVLEGNPNKDYDYKEIAHRLGIDDTQGRNELIRRLGELKQKERIIETKKGRYQKAEGPTEGRSRAVHEGVLDLNSSGNGYVVSEGFEDDVFIPRNRINRAFHGDTVGFILSPKRGGRKREGEIVEIIQRKKETFVGVFEPQKSYAFVRPADTRMYTDIFIPQGKFGEAAAGDKVVVRLRDWPEDADSPYGHVIEVLGRPGEHGTEIHAILAEYGLPHDFEPDIERYAQGLDLRIDEEEVARRRDMREVLTFTIDPKDAKDFDDALSFRTLENGNYEIGIHIADVSHYVVPDTPLDEEALERATSVYLVDRVVPMLPEILSNGACSLRPHEDKYTFSAVFEIDADANVRNQWFGRTVTHSDARFAYEEAQFLLDNPDADAIPDAISIRNGEGYPVDPAIAEAVRGLDRLAKIMRDRRMRDGAISFDKVEVRFQLDADNDPVGVYFKEAKAANKLIEEFMLLANRKVAEFIGKRQGDPTFVYRIHDEPDEEKLIALNGVISKFGHHVDLKDVKTISHSLNQLLSKVRGKKEQNLVDTLTIRSMSKAMYTTENIGHYGLAFEYYTHFTSPIRRYPDVMVHRLLQHYLDGGKPPKKALYESWCQHSTSREILASQAERDSVKYMQIRYMQTHMDQEFLGVISGVTEWGIYVEIVENKCEGMVRIRDIRDDHYVFDQRQYAIVGERKGEVYQLGEEVYVMVKNADLERRHLDFALIGKKAEKAPMPAR